MTSAKYAFEPFKSDVQSVISGNYAFKIFPQGKFYRGDRVLDITAERLKEMESNFKSGLPRFKVPINENHSGVGKIGTILDVEYRASDPEGAGLYATKYEFTDQGKKLLTEKRYDAISGEVLWSLNDAKYQDPNTGEFHDNVISGAAICDQPFFGHEQVALFSDRPNKEPSLFDQIKKAVSEVFADNKQTPVKVEIEVEDDDEEESDKPITPVKGKQSMADPTEVQADTFDAKAKIEEMSTQFAQKQEEFATQLKAANDRAEELNTKLANEQKTRELFAYTAEAATFSSLALKADEYADKMWQLAKVNPELAKWVKDKFAQFDTMIAQGSLFSQITRTNAEVAGDENLETLTAKILADEFNGDKTKYADAVVEASKRNPSFVPAEMRSRKIRQ